MPMTPFIGVRISWLMLAKKGFWRGLPPGRLRLRRAGRAVPVAADARAAKGRESRWSLPKPWPASSARCPPFVPRYRYTLSRRERRSEIRPPSYRRTPAACGRAGCVPVGTLRRMREPVPHRGGGGKHPPDVGGRSIARGARADHQIARADHFDDSLQSDVV